MSALPSKADISKTRHGKNDGAVRLRRQDDGRFKNNLPKYRNGNILNNLIEHTVANPRIFGIGICQSVIVSRNKLIGISKMNADASSVASMQFRSARGHDHRRLFRQGGENR